MDNIMIVNKDFDQLEATNKYLSNAGYLVFTADNGVSALAKAQLFKPDLILLETELPDMSGYDVCKKLKSSEETKFILITILSNLDSHDHAIMALKAGADDFLTKTFDPAMLITKVRSILRIKHLSDQLKSQYAELQEKDRIIDYEMKMAKHVQRSLIQEFDTKFGETYFLSKYMPAMDIGGDFYDIIPMPDGKIAVIMGDVSGHGISAALLTSMLNLMIKTLVDECPLPNQLLEKMNLEFCNIFSKGISDIYACVFYALIDTNEKTITYSNAGHALPYFIDSKNNSTMELSSYGIPIGLMKESQYDNLFLEYSNGDILFLQTDGLQDVFYKEKPEEYSQKVREILLEFRTSKPKEVLELITSMFYTFDLTETEKYEIDDVSLIYCLL